MRRGWFLIAFLAIAAVLALPALVTAHAHDGPVMVAVLDAAVPATVALSALPAHYTVASSETGSLGRTESVDYGNACVTAKARDHAGNELQPRARDVRGSAARG